MTKLSAEMLTLVRQAAAAEQAAAREMLRGGDLDSMVSTVQGDALDRLRGQTDRSPLAGVRECRAGCSMCCLTVQVDATCLEALAIAAHVLEHVDPERREVIVERLRKSAERREALSRQQRQQVRLACAFLDRDGLCSIYESRPLACAGVFSLSQQACDDAYQADALAVQQIPLDQPAKLATLGVSAGLQRALVEAGLDGNLYELHSAVYRAVTTAKAAERFFAGEDVFAGCLCTDAHSPPRLAEPAAQPEKSSRPHRRKLSKQERKQRKRLLAKRNAGK